MTLGTVVSDILEAIMSKSIAIIASVWCGVAFLRARGWGTSDPDERLALQIRLLPDPGETQRGFDSPSPHTD